jgi:hypothetical protein
VLVLLPPRRRDFRTDRLKQDGFRRPVLLLPEASLQETYRALGMRLPEGLSVAYVAERLPQVRRALRARLRRALPAGPAGTTPAPAGCSALHLCRLPLPPPQDLRITTMDVRTQMDGPKLSGPQWAAYFGDKEARAKQLLNVVSLELAGTPLGDEVGRGGRWGWGPVGAGAGWCGRAAEQGARGSRLGGGRGAGSSCSGGGRGAAAG